VSEYAGVGLRDQQVRFDVGADEARAANRAQRTRLLETVTGLSAADWSLPSRCAGWSIQDVVRHLAQINRVQVASVEAGLAGERFDGFRGFDPKSTPGSWLKAAGDEPAPATLAEFTRSTASALSTADQLASRGDELLVATPAGRQPWHRAILHASFDSAVHERDILEPLGRRAAADPAEVGAIAAYQLLLNARVLAVVGVQLDLALCLDPGIELRAIVDGAIVEVRRDRIGGAALVGSGPADQVLDAMSGRGDLAEAVSGPPEVATALSALRGLL